MRNIRMRWGLGVAMAVALLASGCMDFSQEHYCREHPDVCEMRMTHLSPDWSPPQGGSTVDLFGSGFEPDTQVEVDGISVPTEVKSTGHLYFKTPPSSPGVKDIVLRSRVQTVTLPSAIRYGPPPANVITSISPATGSYQGGTQVTLRLQNIAVPFSVRIGGQPLTQMTITPYSSVTGLTPPGVEGAQDVEIVTSGGSTVRPGAYTYTVNWAEANEGLSGADVLSLAVDPVDASFILAGTRGSGLHRSTDHGHTWSRVSDIPSTASVHVLLVEPGSRTVHAATSRGYFRSTNAGVTWDRPRDPLDYRALEREADGTLFAFCFNFAWGEFYQLRPGAQSWENFHSFFDSGTGNTIRALASGGDFRYAATRRGLMRYHKRWLSGASWVDIGPAPGTLDAYAVAVLSGTPDVVYVGGLQGLYRIDAESPSGRLLYKGAPVLSVTVEPSRPGTLYLGTSEGLLVSTDSGTTWSTVPGALSVKHQAVVSGPGEELYVGGEAGVFVREAGQPLVPRNTGLSPGRVLGLEVDATRPELVYAILPGRLFRSTDGGGHWAAVPTTDVPSPRQVRADPVREGVVYVATDSGVRRSLDGGATWALVGAERRVRQLAIASSAPQTLYVTAEDGLWRSDDAGETWRSFGAGLPTSASPFALAVSATKPDLLYTHQGKSIYRFSPEVAEWRLAGSLYGEPRSLVVDPKNDAILYALTPEQSYRSGDGGSTWQTMSYGNKALRLVAEGNTTTLFEGGFLGEVHRGVSNGGTSSISWTSISRELPSSLIREIAPAPSNLDIIYVGTETRGVWKTRVGGRR